MKERLRARKLHSKLIEIQLLECILLIILYVLSYDLAWGFIYNNFFPFFILDDHFLHISASALVIIILSFYKSFNFLEQSRVEVIKKVAISSLLLNALFVVLLYFSTEVELSVQYFFFAYVTQIMLFMLVKTFTEFLKRKRIEKSHNLVIAEDLRSAAEFLKDFRNYCKGRIDVVSHEDEDLRTYVTDADNIILAGSMTRKFRSEVVSYGALEDKKIFFIPDVYEIAVKNSVSDFIGDTPVFTIQSFQLTELQTFVKRLEDIVLSLFGILITAPIFIIASISIKREDGGPVFYTQERCGLNGKVFKVIKFRSMVVDAEKNTGAVLAADNDQRITKTGCFMRSVRIDEIPQFFNVLIGNMSLVGPRPERPVFVEEYSRRYPEYYCRLAVKPGITGLAQVKGRYTTSAEKKLKFDLMYIINYTLLLDIKILFQTIGVILKKENANGYSEWSPSINLSESGGDDGTVREHIERRLQMIKEMNGQKQGHNRKWG